MGLIASFESMNAVSLERLQTRIDAITAQIEAALAQQGKTLQTASQAELETAISSSGLTSDDLIDALITSKKRAL